MALRVISSLEQIIDIYEFDNEDSQISNHESFWEPCNVIFQADYLGFLISEKQKHLRKSEELHI